MSFQTYFPNGIYNPFIIKEIDEDGTLIVERPFFEQINFQANINKPSKNIISVGRTIIDLTIPDQRNIFIQIIPIQSEPGENWNNYLLEFNTKRDNNKRKNLSPTDHIEYFGNEPIPDKYKIPTYENKIKIEQHKKVEDFTNDFTFDLNGYFNYKQQLFEKEEFLSSLITNYNTAVEQFNQEIETLEENINIFKINHNIELNLTDQKLENELNTLSIEEKEIYDQLIQELIEKQKELKQLIFNRDEFLEFIERKKIIKKKDLDKIGFDFFESYAHNFSSTFCINELQEYFLPKYYGPKKIYVEYRFQDLNQIMFKTYLPNQEYEIYNPIKWYENETFNAIKKEDCNKYKFILDPSLITNDESEENEEIEQLKLITDSIFDKYPMNSWKNIKSGIIPIGVIPAGTKKIQIIYHDSYFNDDLLIFTKNGHHLAGIELTDLNIIKPSYGFEENSVYDNSYINSGKLGTIQVDDDTQYFLNFELLNKELINEQDKAKIIDNIKDKIRTTTYNDITIKFSGDLHESNIHIEYLEIENVTEDLLIFSIGIGNFNLYFDGEMSTEVPIDEESEPSNRLPQACVFFASYQHNYKKNYNSFHIVDHKKLMEKINSIKHDSMLIDPVYPLVDSTKCHIIQGYNPNIPEFQWVHEFTFNIQHFLCLVANKYLFDIIVKTRDKIRIYCCHYNTFPCCNKAGFNIEPRLIIHELDPEIYSNIIFK